MSGRNRSSHTEVPIECMVNMSVQRFKLGEILWCRINSGSWWPVQVVDENCVAFKPKRKKKDQILVRLYGTFEHMYVEKANCISKTEKIYEEENRSSREIFEKALEEDLSRMKSGYPSEGRLSKSIENVKEKDEASRGKGQRKGNLKRAKIEANSPLVDCSDNPKAAKKVKLVVRALRSGTRSETFEGGNNEKSGTEDAGEMQNLGNWASKIRSLDKNDSSCERISDAYTTDILDAKDIKRLVAKIVREVAAENARNEALKAKEMRKNPGKIEYVETTKKESYEMENLQLHIPRREENRDTDIPIAGNINDTGAINGHFHQQTKMNDPPSEMETVKLFEPDVAINGDQRVNAVKDALGEQVNGAGTGAGLHNNKTRPPAHFAC
ncbi:hypothetical protein KSP39_PZI003072 [Platanthera zijinensis]|uniref:PWWP domain-containing protein n=1 Tax=Platanthera zijinensis TaxID=2320716 RepID=A0AAP0BTT1_9ASPA